MVEWEHNILKLARRELLEKYDNTVEIGCGGFVGTVHRGKRSIFDERMVRYTV
jgi:hypothetical protein